MAKSMRSKKLKRLRAIRREIVEPFYDKKDAAKLAAQEAALAAPKVPVPALPSSSPNSMEVAAVAFNASMDVEMADGNQNKSSLKPAGGVGKQSKRKFKVGKNKVRESSGESATFEHPLEEKNAPGRSLSWLSGPGISF